MTWYIEPLDDATNHLIAEELPEENAVRGAECADEKKRNLWKCTYDFISKLGRSKSSLRIKFNIFNQKKTHAPIRKWKFG
jgi:hypothetical protein